MVVDALRRKRCEALLRKGYARIREGQFDAAIEVATQLEAQRHSGGFEVAALARAGKGELETAVTILQRGVEVAPDVGLNWQLLGNYLSDLERYDDADAAYRRALACPGCSRDSVRLNLAILAERRHRPEVVLELLDTLRDPALAEHAREIRVSALHALSTSGGRSWRILTSRTARGLASTTSSTTSSERTFVPAGRDPAR